MGSSDAMKKRINFKLGILTDARKLAEAQALVDEVNTNMALAYWNLISGNESSSKIPSTRCSAGAIPMSLSKISRDLKLIAEILERAATKC